MNLHRRTRWTGNSNVVKLYTALKLDHDQVAYYHPGVGTLGDPSKKGIAREWSVVKGLAFGYGFRDNVLDAYRIPDAALCVRRAGVYLRILARGAYTARGAWPDCCMRYGLLCRGQRRAYSLCVAHCIRSRWQARKS